MGGGNKFQDILTRLKEKGRTKGYRWREGTLHGSGAWGTTLSGEYAIKLENNTFAWMPDVRDSRQIRVRYYQTDLFTWHSNGLQVIESSVSSMHTRQRFNTYLDGWHVGTDTGKDAASEMVIWRGNYWNGPDYGDEVNLPNLCIPCVPGMVAGNWQPTEIERVLCLAARLGDGRACLRLADLIMARGGLFVRMGQILRDFAGKRWAVRGQIRYLQGKLHAYLDNLAHITGGLWLADAHTGELVRALTVEDVVLYGYESQIGKTCENGKYTLVDGFVYSAKTDEAAE